MRRIIWKGVFVLNWGIILFYWFRGTGSYVTDGFYDSLSSLGHLAGLVGAYLILTQFFLMGRNPLIEGVFGLDNLSRFHQKNGKVALIILLFHPVLLVIGHAGSEGGGWWPQYLEFFHNYEDVGTATLGLALLVVMVGLSISIVRMRLRYETWYFTHLIAYVAVFFSFGHQINIGEDILASRLFYGYWLALYIGVFGSHLVFRFLRPTYRFFRHRFRVARIERESPDAVSLYLSGNDISSFPVRPGQFMIVRFLVKGLWWQAHPFSLSMVPNGKEIRITVKELGDFTKQVSGVPVGTQVFIDGPYGVFTDLFSVSKKALFIAGGIGITPIRSLMEEMMKKGKDVVLLYGNKTKQDIVFKKEIDALNERYSSGENSLHTIHILSNDTSYEGPRGYIDGEKIKELVPDVRERDVYICGPIPMMDSLVEALNEMGAPVSHIHYEKFSF